MLESMLMLAPKARMPRTDDREARFRAWRDGLSPEEQRAKIKAGHVRVNLPPLPGKIRKTRKRTVAAQRRSLEVDIWTAQHGEAYVHMTPLQRFGLREAIAKRDAAA